MTDQTLCRLCDHRHPSRGEPGAPLVDGTYSPSGFVFLRSGQLECPECKGYGEEECDEEGAVGTCYRCRGESTVACDHRGQEPYPDTQPPVSLGQQGKG